MDWKIPAGGNSGIFYHVKEGYKSIPEVAPEYQLIDDEGYAGIHDLTEYNLSLGYTEHPEELKPLEMTGADYAMHPPSTKTRSSTRSGSGTPAALSLPRNAWNTG